MRPGPDEFDAYFRAYVGAVGDDVFTELSASTSEWRSALDGVGDGDGGLRYAPEKWSLTQVLGHVIDAERVFSYRALQFARGDAGPLPGMDQEVWTAASSPRPLSDLLVEFVDLRSANSRCFAGFGPDELERSGVASGVSFTVRALIWIAAGHARHHLTVLNERYLPLIQG